jgi:hypothetical protein
MMRSGETDIRLRRNIDRAGDVFNGKKGSVTPPP